MDLAGWGWGDDLQAAYEALDDATLAVGRVTTQERSGWAVETSGGRRAARIPSSTSAAALPAVGDWVVLRPGPSPTDPWNIEGVLPRRTQFSRRVAGSRTEEQVLGANVDVVWIVHGLDALPNPRRLERYLALGWESGAQPAIVLTKADVAIGLAESVEMVEGLAFGTPVWVVTLTDDESITNLAASLRPGSTVALLGPSGVGKSSLVNRIAGDEQLMTGAVREADRKGRHTTTRRQLTRVPGGALLLDTPGMRELGVWDLDEGLPHAFPDIDTLATECRFRDCGHKSEPGCAVLAAVGLGTISAARLESFRKLQAEAAYQQRKADPQAQAQAVADFKSAMKTLKHHPKVQRRR